MREYKLIRSGRKTIALYVRDGIAEVRAPLRVSKAEIDKFVASKEDWINKRLEKYTELSGKRAEFKLYYGGTAAYRGKECTIVPRAGDRIGFTDETGQFYIPEKLTSEQIKSAVIQIYKLLAKRDLSGRVLAFQQKMGVSVTGLKISSAKTNWGSMSGKRSVNFSWRLMMADDDLIDYVVVHELAHVTEMNHSARFWAIVESIVLDYREKKERLKELQRRLSAENWEAASEDRK